MGNRLAGRVALITGGTSGMGRGTVDRFVDEGAKVVIADIQDEKGGVMSAEFGSSLEYVHCDVSNESDVKAAVEAATSRFGRLDVLFNNAGIVGMNGDLHDLDMSGWDHTVGVLFKSVVLGMKYAAPLMAEQGGGSIINTASVAGITGGFGPHVYSGCKAAVIQVTRTAALELGPRGVRVNAICPGGIATSIFGRGLGLSFEQADRAAKLIEGAFDDLQPIKRTGLPTDIANAALFLASDESSFVSGQAIAVDGALTAGRERRADDQNPLAEKLLGVFAEVMKQEV